METYISVDVETAGPIPGEFSLLQIGAAAIYGKKDTFSCFVKPITTRADPEALRVTGLNLREVEQIGDEPVLAMQRFSIWIEEISGPSGKPIFVGLNAPFDWSFVNYYFIRFLGHNPFGISGIDIKSMFMGAVGCAWDSTTSDLISKALNVKGKGDHDARNDAIFQAELFRRVKAIRAK